MITAETRMESYYEVLPKLGERQKQILRLLEIKPMTADELAQLLFYMGRTNTLDRNTASPRLTELRNAGVVETVGKRMGSRGRMQAVWAIKEE